MLSSVSGRSHVRAGHVLPLAPREQCLWQPKFAVRNRSADSLRQHYLRQRAAITTEIARSLNLLRKWRLHVDDPADQALRVLSDAKRQTGFSDRVLEVPCAVLQVMLRITEEREERR